MTAAACGAGFLVFDLERLRTPYASPEKNPFLDRRVRLAFLQGIDTGRLAREVLKGFGQPATQLVAPPVFGFDPGFVPPSIDSVAARALLAQAGLPSGFTVTLDATKGAYPGDAAAAARVAESLGEIGVTVHVNFLPKAELWGKLARRDTSFYLLHTRDPARGLGSENAGGYSNPEVDRLFDEARETMAPGPRLNKLQAAARLALQDVPWVPLYIQDQVYAIREPWDWTPRADKRIRADEVRRP